ncbi:helix-turn-helix domain-containing protein [Aliterella atlantica]|uniref:helix-turn-helix domain-containing protein n=1 Tax=Aliterella atlantica TaxID=1827278 RepID=UPI0009080921|nr:helix-turn-helix transcriptional regulator [Aliterella atlantica]
MTIDSMPLRNRVKELVDNLGISRYQFCKDTGLTQNTGYRLYKDADYIPGSDALLKICKAYKIQPGVLIEYIPEEDDGNQKALNKQEQPTESMPQWKSASANQVKHRRTRSFLSVVPKVQESA